MDTMVPRRILVVDDDLSILRLVATILRRERYEVDTAGGGRDALAKIELTQYDVIVLDLMMPDVNGFDVLKSLHAHEPDTQCVVIMSAAPAFDVASAINPNVYATLSKPFDNVRLIAAVRGCVDATCAPSGPVLPIPAAA